MQDGVCPVVHSNYPDCGCAEGECEVFDEFGMACDKCGAAGHRDSDGWAMQPDGEIWCCQCDELKKSK